MKLTQLKMKRARELQKLTGACEGRVDAIGSAVARPSLEFQRCLRKLNKKAERLEEMVGKPVESVDTSFVSDLRNQLREYREAIQETRVQAAKIQTQLKAKAKKEKPRKRKQKWMERRAAAGLDNVVLIIEE